MWLGLNDGFISAVMDWSDPTGESLIIRARAKNDLENIFPNREITETYDSDYRYRVFLSKKELISIITKRIEDINYTNFKNSVADKSLHDMYLKFWTAGWQRQNSSR